MSKKSNKKEENKPKDILKTTELKNFINVLKEVDEDVSDDIGKNKKVVKNVDSKKKEEKKVIKDVPELKDEEIEEYKTSQHPIIQISDEKQEEPKVEQIPNKGFYFGFYARFTLNILLLFVAIVGFVYSLFLAFSITDEELIRYSVSSNIDYKVYLKRNDFYDTPYLGKGMAYVSSLIDKININYNYRFDVSRQSDIDFDYKVIARLVIANKSNSNIFFDKEYVLKDSKVEEMRSATSHLIDEVTEVNYSYYNNIANKFRSKYAVDTTSYLDVYLLVNEKNSEENNYKLDNKSKAILTIPLSMQEINISLNEADINENNQVLSNSRILIKDTGSVIISVVLFVLVVLLFVRLIKKLLLLTAKKTAYDNYVNRLLRAYDRIIVNIKTIPNFRKYNVIKVDSFQELVDVRDNLKLPINYYVISEHQKCEFFIISNDDVYRYVVKAVDVEKGLKK